MSKRYTDQLKEELCTGTHVSMPSYNIKKASKKTPVLGAYLLTALMALSAACGKSTQPKPDPDPIQYDHAITFEVNKLQDDTALTGTVEAVRISDSKSYVGTFGQKIDLGKTANKEELFNFKLYGGPLLQKEINSASVKVYTIKLTMADSTTLDVAGLLNNVLFDGVNWTWEPTVMNITWNPDYWMEGNVQKGTGKRLSKTYKDAIISTAYYLSDNSKGRIPRTSVTFSDTNYTIDGKTPPYGEIRVFRTSNPSYQGVSNISFDYNKKVTSGAIFINVDGGAGANQGKGELCDMMALSNQNMGEGIPNWWKLMFTRPKGIDNGYHITTTGETQSGFDSVGMQVTEGAQAYYMAVQEQNTDSSINPFTPYSADYFKQPKYVRVGEIEPEVKARVLEKPVKRDKN